MPLDVTLEEQGQWLAFGRLRLDKLSTDGFGESGGWPTRYLISLSSTTGRSSRVPL